MKTRRRISWVLGLAMAFTLNTVSAQVTEADNNIISPDSYVGCDGGSTVPLKVMHNANLPIEFWTDTTFRMQLWNTSTANINGYGSVKQNGFLGISDEPAFFTNSPGAFTRIHLVDSVNSNSGNPSTYAQQLGYRLWQRNGVTMTGNSDQCYIGAKYNGNDTSDLVLQWSDNSENQPWGTDRLRMLFTTRRNSEFAYGAPSEEGLESFRVFVVNDTVANVGIGDFYRASALTGTPQDPTEKLHVTDGTIRMDSLIPDYRNDTLSRVVMTDGLGRLHWRPMSTWPQDPGGGGGADCDWGMSGLTLSTAYAGPPFNSCPDRRWKVGIGTGSPTYKVQIDADRATSGSTGGLYVVFRGLDSVWSYGTFTRVLPSQTILHRAVASYNHLSGVRTAGTGVHGLVQMDVEGVDADGVSGVRGDAQVEKGNTFNAIGVGGYTKTAGLGTATNGYGVVGRSSGVAGSMVNSYGVHGSAASGQTNYAIYGTAPVSANNWAGYFKGAMHVAGPASCTASAWTSDGSLKTEVEDVANAGEVLAQVRPRTYRFDTSGNAHMNLPEGLQYGVIAQELEQVLPDAVVPITIPAETDTLGHVIAEARTIKGVNYIALIPLLVAGYQQQQAELAELREMVQSQNTRLDAMQADLAACCANPDGRQRIEPLDEGHAAPANDRKLLIVPNPFSEPPTVHYILERGGRMQLLVNSSDGRDLRVLEEAVREAGEYRHQWNTKGLAPGTYFVTLLLDGEPVVKKAVKVM